MASETVEREIEEWVERCPLKRKSIMGRLRVVPNARHYDKMWKQALRDLEKQTFIDRFTRS